MPIDKTQWEQGQPWRAVETRILEFLKKNPDKAYTAKEIADEVVGHDPKAPALIFEIMAESGTAVMVFVTLESLIRQGKVEARKIAKIPYYKAV